MRYVPRPTWASTYLVDIGLISIEVKSFPYTGAPWQRTGVRTPPVKIELLHLSRASRHARQIQPEGPPQAHALEPAGVFPPTTYHGSKCFFPMRTSRVPLAGRSASSRNHAALSPTYGLRPRNDVSQVGRHLWMGRAYGPLKV